jgi:hypothetical protein
MDRIDELNTSIGKTESVNRSEDRAKLGIWMV